MNKVITVTIQIGNSDDKLTQSEWSKYVKCITATLELNKWLDNVHFSGGSSNWEPWQNYCWIINVDEKWIDYMKMLLYAVRKEYKQDSIAFTVGETDFI